MENMQDSHVVLSLARCYVCFIYLKTKYNNTLKIQQRYPLGIPKFISPVLQMCKRTFGPTDSRCCYLNVGSRTIVHVANYRFY